MKAGGQVNHDLLWKGLMLVAIGLAVLFGPMFMAPTAMRDTVAQSAAVGWFALVLGVAFMAQYLWRRRADMAGSGDPGQR